GLTPARLVQARAGRCKPAASAGLARTLIPMRRNEIMATAATPAHWQPIGEIVAEFRTECSDFEHLVQSLFDQLDQLRGELERKGRELEKERQRVAERERQLSEQRKETSRFAH